MVTKSSRPHRIDNATAYAKDHGIELHPKARASLKEGYFVKLAFLSDTFQNGTDNERLWVEVTGRSGTMFTGVLRSSPAFLKDLMPGEAVLFGAEHVADISLPARNANDPAAC